MQMGIPKVVITVLSILIPTKAIEHPDSPGTDDALQMVDLVNLEEEGFLETDIFYVNGAISRRLYNTQN